MARPRNTLCECGGPLNGRSRNQGCLPCKIIDEHRFGPPEPRVHSTWSGGPNILNLANGQTYHRPVFLNRGKLRGEWDSNVDPADPWDL